MGTACPSLPVNRLTQVALPAGRLKLVAKPTWTGSKPLVNTMGIVAVAPFFCRGRRSVGGDQHNYLSNERALQPARVNVRPGLQRSDIRLQCCARSRNPK